MPIYDKDDLALGFQINRQLLPDLEHFGIRQTLEVSILWIKVLSPHHMRLGYRLSITGEQAHGFLIFYRRSFGQRLVDHAGNATVKT